MTTDEHTAVAAGKLIEANKTSARAFLRLLEEKRVDAWIELWAEDADHFYPFGTRMFPEYLTGRSAVYERWKDMPGMFRRLRFPVRGVWADGDTVVLRFDGECLMHDGTTYRNTYVSLLTFDEAGKIRFYEEYFDPIEAGLSFGMLDVAYRTQA
jgi:ketosteroid isomerase-like protein